MQPVGADVRAGNFVDRQRRAVLGIVLVGMFHHTAADRSPGLSVKFLFQRFQRGLTDHVRQSIPARPAASASSLECAGIRIVVSDTAVFAAEGTDR